MLSSNPSKVSISELDFPNIPSFPGDAPTAPLLRISLQKLLSSDRNEEERVWRACCELGFFYLDLRKQKDQVPANEIVGGDIDGNRLLTEAEQLFKVQKEFYKLPVEEKQKYDFADQGSYFGYKGYGTGVVDKVGTRDRNEFYNVSKDSILGLTAPVPAPPILDPYAPLLESFIKHSHSVATLLLSILSARLGLPSLSNGGINLPSLHRLGAISGDQVRFIKAPPQPPDDRRTILGEHTDFGSVTILFNRIGGLQVLLPPYIQPIAPHIAAASNGTKAAAQSRDAKEKWTYVKPLPGHCIVNLGDALVKFSAQILRSNIHRVNSPPGPQAHLTRYSLVYFARAEDDILLRPLTEGDMVREAVKRRKAKGESIGEESVTAKEWILRRALGRRLGGNFEASGGTEDSSRGVREVVRGMYGRR